MSTLKKSWRRGVVALAVTAALGLASTATYAAGEGIVGTVEVGTGSVTDYTVSIKNPATGFTREIQLTDSSFRFTQLPVGEYEVIVMKAGAVVAKDKVRVALGANAQANFDLNTTGAETIEVVGARPSAIDLTTSDSGLVIGESEFDALPVARNLNAVALLAPGTVQGESRFGTGNLVSFGGSSVAENSCYINGLEVTDTRQGLGCGTVPFEFYKEFQVKTGGYSAQFGRTTGGVINAVTKSGTNEWDFAGTFSMTPDSLRSDGQVSYSTSNTGAFDNAVFRDTREDENDFSEFTLSAAGPLIQDKLFIYALVNPRSSEQVFTGNGGQTTAINRRNHDESKGGDNMFWGAKLDWDISENHRVSLFSYSNRNDTEREVYRYNAQTGAETITPGASGPDSITLERGGEATSLTYTGHLTDDITLSILTGKIETQFYNDPSNTLCPAITDARTTPVGTRIGGSVLGCGPGTATGENNDETEQQRLDLEWVIGDHIVHAGVDLQTRDSTNKTYPIKGAFGTNGTFTYSTLAADPDGAGPLRGGSVPTDTTRFFNNTAAPIDIVRNRIFETTVDGGEFSSDMEAFYIEDTWQINSDLSVTLGMRSDSLTNYGSSGVAFADFQNETAPRLGATWDPTGEGKSKLYFTWGRYFLPIPNNTNFRMASGIYDATTSYRFTGVNSDGTPSGLTPVQGTVADSTATNSPGDVYPGTDLTQAKEAKPFYKEETIIGYETELSDELTGSARYIFRDTASALDDYCGDLAPNCVLLNPGEGGTWGDDNDHDGVVDPGTYRYHSAAEIGIPDAKNVYHALQMQLDHRSEKMRWSFLYTWSRSYGNFEGSVKSDIAQADAGITQDFDFPALMEGSDGYQANDRRHVFKFFGAYKLTDDLSVGWNSTLSDGRPLSRFGQSYHTPTDDHLYGSYGDTFYSSVGGNYEYMPRGRAGRTPWTFSFDMSMDYTFNVGEVEMKASLDIFNILNIQEVTAYDEHYEVTAGTRNPYYGSAYTWQAPRSVRLGFEARF